MKRDFFVPPAEKYEIGVNAIAVFRESQCNYFI
jgi:hypothetical protein